MRSAACTIILLASCASALACDNGEYAQYKDRAKADPMDLARDYCLAKDIWDIRRTSGKLREAKPCGDEMSKILDALSAVKAKKAIRYIEKTCPIQVGQP